MIALISVKMKGKELYLTVHGKDFHENINLIKRMPQRRFDANSKMWVIPRQDIDALISRVGMPNLAWHAPLPLIRGEKWTVPDPLAGITISKTGIDNLPITIPDFQLEGASFLLQKKCALLADEMGVGKTIQAGLALRQGILSGQIEKALIVCPSSVKLQWADELQNKMLLPSVVVVDGTVKQRQKQWALAKDMNIVVTNYETLRNKQDMDFAQDFNPDAIIVDEAHYIKNRTTLRTNAIFNIQPQFRWILTGTPLENRPDEIYTLMNYINKDILPTWEMFEKKYIIKEYSPKYRAYVIIGYRDLHELHEKISSHMLRRMRKEVLTHLPKSRVSFRTVEFNDKQKQLYLQIEKKLEEMRRAVPKNEEEKEELFNSMLGQVQLQLEICDSPELIRPTKEAPRSSKINEIITLLKETFSSNPTTKVIIFTQFVGMQMLVAKALKEEKITHVLLNGKMNSSQRNTSKIAFNEDEGVRVFLTSDAGKEGLNLQIASMLINVDLPCKPSTYTQRIGRMERMGSMHEEVFVINLMAICDGLVTADQKAWKAIQNKQDIVDIVVDGLF